MNTQANVITFVTTVTGVAYLRFLRPFLESVFNVYPDGEVLVYYKDIALDRLVGLQISYPTVAFREQNICIDEDTVAKISGKVRFFYDALRGLRDESRVVFIDCDTLVLRPLDWVFNSNEFDIAVTWKPAGYPLNSGVLLARSTASTKRFLLQWSEQTQ